MDPDSSNMDIVAFCSSRMLPEFDFKIPALTDHRLLSGGWPAGDNSSSISESRQQLC